MVNYYILIIAESGGEGKGFNKRTKTRKHKNTKTKIKIDTFVFSCFSLIFDILYKDRKK